MSELILTEDQAAAVDMVRRFLGQKECRVARVTGYAGTGKTTLIRELAERFGIPTVLTPTGKAALRVREASGVFAMTIHRFLYQPTEDPKTGKPVFKLKEAWEDGMADMAGKLVLIDEASMVDKHVWSDIMKVAGKVGFHVLLMGDLFQLPPVYKDDEGRGFSTLTLPTDFAVDMKTVVRQALDSPIIRASMILRGPKPEYVAMDMLDPIGQDVLIGEIVDMQERGGVAICFTNVIRHKLNAEIRASLWRPENTLEAGEPVLVTQNNYNLDVWNGEVIGFDGWRQEPNEDSRTAVTDRFTNSSMNMHFGVGDVSGDRRCILSPEQFTGKTEAANIGVSTIRRTAQRWYKNEYCEEHSIPYLDCNYGYALTCHKAQGSEWPEVIVVLEDRLAALKGIEKKRWLYTAVTRAKKRVRYVYTEWK